MSAILCQRLRQENGTRPHPQGLTELRWWSARRHQMDWTFNLRLRFRAVYKIDMKLCNIDTSKWKSSAENRLVSRLAVKQGVMAAEETRTRGLGYTTIRNNA